MLANMEYKRSNLILSACRFCYCHLSVLHNIIQPMSYIYGSNNRFTNTNFGWDNLRGFKLNMKWERNWAQAHLLSNVMLPPQVHIPNYFGQVVYPNILKCQLYVRASPIMRYPATPMDNSGPLPKKVAPIVSPLSSLSWRATPNMPGSH